MPKMRLSKTQYLRGLPCPKSLWLSFFRPDLRTPVSPGLAHIFEQGRGLLEGIGAAPVTQGCAGVSGSGGHLYD